MVLPSVTDAPPVEGTDPWPSGEDALAAAHVVARVAREVYGEHLEEVWMYGSRARGDWRADSDLDLLVVMSGVDESRPLQWRFLPKLRDELIRRYEYITQQMISVRGCTPERIHTWNTTFYRSIRQHAIKVL